MEIGVIVLLSLVFAVRFLPVTIQAVWGVSLIAAILFVILKKERVRKNRSLRNGR